MYIPVRMLKISSYGGEQPKRDGFDFSARLISPAIEPFAIFHIIRKNNRPLDSIQLVEDGGEELHWINIENLSSEGENSCLAITAVAELPLNRKKRYRVVHAHGDEYTQYGLIEFSEYGMWKYESLREVGRRLDCVINDMRFLLIGGAPKSGTTWVERLLNSHPNALVTGENMFFEWPRNMPFSEFLSEWEVPYFCKAVPHSPPYLSQVYMMYKGRAEAILGQIGDMAGVVLVGDKSPGYALRLPMILSVWPDIKYIHCIRNPLDVVVSNFFHERNLLRSTPNLSVFKDDAESAEFVKNFDPSSENRGDMFSNEKVNKKLLDEWVRHNKIPLRMAKDYPEKIIIVKYERLLEDFMGAVEHLLAFLGLDSSRSLIEAIEKRNRFESYTGGRKQGEEDVSEFFRKGVSGDYLNYMTEAQINEAKAYLSSSCGGDLYEW